ncbi:MAG: XRE family transcriptional regulator [Proteobacteria bacterium]|nr:XRE family transcriptional regulator [Pseudomonadota bacterium]
MARRASKRISVESSSGNVFADLGLPDAQDLDTKVRLAVNTNRLVAAQRLDQDTAAARLNVSQPNAGRGAHRGTRLLRMVGERRQSFRPASPRSP